MNLIAFIFFVLESDHDFQLFVIRHTLVQRIAHAVNSCTDNNVAFFGGQMGECLRIFHDWFIEG